MRFKQWLLESNKDEVLPRHIPVRVGSGEDLGWAGMGQAQAGKVNRTAGNELNRKNKIYSGAGNRAMQIPDKPTTHVPNDLKKA